MPNYNQLEKKQAKKDKLSLVSNSGRGQFSAGDAKNDIFLCDYKFTASESFAVNDKKYRKHELDAIKAQLEPVIVVVFEQSKRRLAIVNWDYLMGLEKAIEELTKDVETYRDRERYNA